MGKISETITGYPFNTGDELSSKSLNEITEALDGITNKQDIIPDLGAIRSGAALGATAVQPAALNNYYTKNETDGDLATKQDALTAGDNVQIVNNVISATDTKYVASDFDIKDLSDTTDLRTKWDNKQDAISDLSAIRSGAALGATAVQESDLQTALTDYYTSGKTDELLETKQDVINNLSEIEQNAASGKTAFDSLITKQDVIEDLDTIRTGAALGATAIQESGLNEALSVYLTSAQTMELIGEIDHFTVKVVDTLPVSGEPNTIYFVNAEGGEATDAKNEYIYVEGIGWELIGTTRIDLTDYYTKDEIDAELATKQDVLTAGSHIEISGDTINVVGLSDVLYAEITYSELVSLVSTSGLTPGMQYRLTNYECTVANDINAQAINTGHFDIILVADDETTLNENVRFTYHEGDEYFADSNLSAWEGKYSLTNDTTKFAWADLTNGKGVIFWLKDEWNNECPYDFKHIQFKRYSHNVSNNLSSRYVCWHDESVNYNTNDFKYLYTFSCIENDEVIDTSLNNLYKFNSEELLNVSNNIIKPLSISNKQNLNNIIHYHTNLYTDGDYCGGITNVFIDNDSYNMSLLNNCHNIHIEYSNNNHIFGDNTNNVKIGCNTKNITSIYSITYCEIKQSCNNIKFINSCNNFSIGNKNINATFTQQCNNFTIGDNCCEYTVDNVCENFNFGSNNNYWILYNSNIEILPNTIYPNSEIPQTRYEINFPESYSRQLVGLSQYNKIVNTTEFKNAYLMQVLDDTDVTLYPGVYSIWLKTHPVNISFSNTIYGSELREYVVSFLIKTTETNPTITFNYVIKWADNDVPTWEPGYRYEISVICYNNRGYATYNKFLE